MTGRTLYAGLAISKVGKCGRIKIPEAFGSVLSKNGGQLRMVIGKRFTENCWVCYDAGLRVLDVEQCRALSYPRNFDENNSISNIDRSILSSLFVKDLSLS